MSNNQIIKNVIEEMLDQGFNKENLTLIPRVRLNAQNKKLVPVHKESTEGSYQLALLLTKNLLIKKELKKEQGAHALAIRNNSKTIAFIVSDNVILKIPKSCIVVEKYSTESVEAELHYTVY